MSERQPGRAEVERAVVRAWQAFGRALDAYQKLHGEPISVMFPGLCIYDQKELSDAMDQGRSPKVLLDLPRPELPDISWAGGDP